MTLNLKNSRWLIIAVLVIIIDQLTKQIATQHLAYGQPLVVIPVFNLTLAHNFGAAFSFLSNDSGWQRWLFTAISSAASIGLVAWLVTSKSSERLLSIGLSFVLGGALGNLWDRLNYGYVIDFIQVHYHHYYWPVFNAADSAICLGAFLIILNMIFESRK